MMLVCSRLGVRMSVVYLSTVVGVCAYLIKDNQNKTNIYTIIKINGEKPASMCA